MCIVVDRKDNLVGRRQGKADAVSGAEGSSPRCVRASTKDTTGVEEGGMHSQGKPGNLGEPRVSLLALPEE